MKKKYYFVYKTVNIKNGKYYIGVHETFNLDDGYLGSGKVLRNSVHYHGRENFKREILEYCDNKTDMYNKERELVTEEVINDPKCMNLVVGGVGFINDEKHREICVKAGNALAMKYRTDAVFRKRHNKIVAENMKNAHKSGKIKYDTFTGKKHSDEAKKKISESKKGKNLGNKNSQYGTCWITNGVENKKIKITENLPAGWYKGRKI
jgi:hypothetical protein